MSLEERMLAVIQALYDAALDETRWTQALQQLTDFTGSQAASFWVLDGSEQPRLPTFVCINFDPTFIEDYLENMTPLDPTVQYLVKHPKTPIVHDGLVISERDKDRHPYYDWHEGYCDTHFRMVGQVRPGPAIQAGVALHRTRHAGRYEPQDLKRFSVLYQHLERALAIGSRLTTLGTMQSCTTDLLDQNPSAVVLLNQQRHTVYANRSAQALHTEGDGLLLSTNGLALLHRQDHERLQTLVAQALSLAASPRAAGDGIMRASRPSGKRPYLMLVTPISKEYPALSAWRPAVCIIITDPEKQTVFPVSRLQAAFGLTEAEARLAALLANGEELRPSAEKLGITYGTARTRLAEIFQKTETRRQGELIKILLTTLATAE